MDPRDHFPTLPTTTNGAQLPSLLRAPAISPINLTWDETTALTPVPTLVPALPGRVLGLIRFRGHRPKGGYDGQNGIKAGRETSATTVL